MKVFIAALCATLTLALGATSASAADLYVETTGTDSPTCGTTVFNACLTIAQATTNAASSDRVLIGTGTFVISQTINPGNKSIEYIGNGPGNTIISGNNSTSFPQNGMFRFQFDGIDGAVKDMTISQMGKTASGSSRFGVWVQPSLPGPVTLAYAIDATIDNVQFIGNTGVTAAENAVYAALNAGSVTITNCDLDNVMGNSILLEQQIGPATVSGNTIDKPLSNTSSVIFDMTHANAGNTQAYDVTGLHTIGNNTINAAAGITVLGGWPFTAGFGPSAYLGGVTIADNTINTQTGTGTAISLQNATAANDGTPSRILDAEIKDNVLLGNGRGIGILLQGGIPDPVIERNSIRQRSSGILLRRFTQTLSPFTTFDHRPTGTVAKANQIVDNTFGVTTDPSISVVADLERNWWGCNAGPAISASPADGACDTVQTFDASAITLDNWVVLRISAIPAAALASDEVASVTAGFDQLNTGAAAPAVFDNGTPLPMASLGGTLATLTPTLTSSVATQSFTSTGPAGRSADATMDHQTVTHSWNDVPVVSIVSPVDGSSTTADAVPVVFTVSEPSTVCLPALGELVWLDFGPNTISVSCEDDVGNIGTASVSVTRTDDVDPVVTITAPTNGLITASSSVTLNFTVTDDTTTTCNLTDGDSIPLVAGANTITVICIDAFGNLGFDSVSVIRDNTPPIVTIVTPANGLITTAESTVLNYTVAYDFGTVTCDKVDGSSVPLSIGANTITVNCTDTAGNVGTASVVVFRPDSLPACAKDASITNVQRVGSRTRITGIARLQFAGQRVSLQYQPSGSRIIAKPVIRPDGSFTVVVDRPASPAFTSNRARYRVTLNSKTGPWIKLTRRMGATAVTYDGNGGLNISGSVSQPVAPGQPLRVERSDACGVYRQVGWLPVKSNGSFEGTVPTGGGNEAAVFIRLKLRVARSSSASTRFNTYSIVQPVIVDR